LQAFAEAAGANARAEAALYERIVATAVAEVEQEVSRLGRAREEAAAARDAVASASLQSQLARARYTSGLSSFLDVLVADRAFADAEIALAAAEGRILDAGVSVAAALGLGQEP
jgi:outer membrane protein TolC